MRLAPTRTFRGPRALADVTRHSPALLCVFIIPVDVYLVSNSVDFKTGKQAQSQHEIDSAMDMVQLVYNILYMTLFVVTFFVIPFAYFYYEEHDDSSVSRKAKIFTALKFSCGFMFAAVILIIIGLVLKPSPSKDKDQKWVNDLLDTSHAGEQAISFIMASLMLLGIPGFVIYAGYGLSAWPIGMIKGSKNVAREKKTVTSDLAVVREQKRALEYKYQLGNKKKSKKDIRDLNNLQKRERLLGQQEKLLSTKEKSFLNRLAAALRPFALLFGILFILLSLFFVVSLAMSTVDRLKNSTCGVECGFAVKKHEIPNPVDIIFVAMHKVFPIDYIFLAATIFFWFMATISGMTRIGIRFLWVSLYKIRTRKTVPQGVLLVAMVMNFLLLTFSLQLLTLAPQYTTFGAQTYIGSDGDVLPCSRHISTCTPTRLANLVSRVSVQMSFFSLVFYYENWAFVGFFLLGLGYSALRARPSIVGDADYDSDDSDV